MAWVTTESLSFTARHDEADAAAAQDLLADLETFRAELAELYPKTPGDIAVIIHPRPWALSVAQPWLPLARMAASPASRRYMAGWFARREIHVLAPDALEERASPVEGSREALMLSPLHEYAHIAIAVNNPALPPPFRPRAFRQMLTWAWLWAGAAQWLSGQTAHARPAIGRRLREGAEPRFPPALSDALLLGGSVLDLLAREEGPKAVVNLVADPNPGTPTRALERAFGGRDLIHTAGTWRAHLAHMAGSD